MYKSMHKYEKIAPYIHAHEVSRVSNMVPGHTSMRVTGLYQCTQEWRAIANKVQGRKSIWDCPLQYPHHGLWIPYSHTRAHTRGGGYCSISYSASEHSINAFWSDPLLSPPSTLSRLPPTSLPLCNNHSFDCLCGTESVFIQAVVPARSTMLREDGPTPRNI